MDGCQMAELPARSNRPATLGLRNPLSPNFVASIAETARMDNINDEGEHT